MAAEAETERFDSENPMSLEGRVLFLEFVIESIIWGPHLDDQEHRQTIAAHLYTCVEASQRHQAHPPAVQRALLRYADGLAGIDSIPDALKPTLRPIGPPTSTGEE